MKYIIAIVALSFATVTLALPLDLGGNSVVIEDDLKSWGRDFAFNGQRIRIGVGWKKDGTVAAGGRVVAAVDGEEFPISAAVSTNIQEKEPMKHIKYEVGTQVKMKKKRWICLACSPLAQPQTHIRVRVPASQIGIGVKQDSAFLYHGAFDKYIAIIRA